VKFLGSAVLAVVLLASLVGGCTKGGTRATTTPKTSSPTTTVSALPGTLALVAEAGRPGDEDLDKRSRLSEIKELLPSPRGGVIVVSHKDDRIFSEITPAGQVRGFLLQHGATLSDGTVFAGAMTALLNSDGSAFVINDARVLARIKPTGQAINLGTVPKGSATEPPHLLKDKAGAPIVELGGSVYRVGVVGEHASFSKLSIKSPPTGFNYSALSPDGKDSYADNGKDRVVRLNSAGEASSVYHVQANGGIASLSPGDANSAWVGMTDGSVFHLLVDGRTKMVVRGGATCSHAFNPSPASGSISDADVLLAMATQVYISDPGCRRIVALGVSG
jgi:hypothetical protein